MFNQKKGQSLLEYAILLSVVVAALIIMQFILKRGYEGGLKDASDKMGDRYSVASGTADTQRTLGADQVITEYQATGEQMDTFAAAAGLTNNDILSNGAIQLQDRSGIQTTISNTVRIDSAKNEKVRWDNVTATNETYPEPTMDAGGAVPPPDGGF